MNCRVCQKESEPFMTFGRMPIANGFLYKQDIPDEYFFELATVFCTNCFTFQLYEQPDQKYMFHQNYAFFSRTSKRMIEHFKKKSTWLINNYLKNKKNPFVIEIGSNDGILLENFSKLGIRNLGIEPSENVANEAKKYGVKSIIDFLKPHLIQTILTEYGKADIICSANVMCHIPDLNEVAFCIASLLDNKGFLIFEDPYLGSMINKTSYDQIYDEHVFIFSALSINNIFKNHGLELIDVFYLDTHGGSMRYVLAHKGEFPINQRVNKVINNEMVMNLNKLDTFKKFKNKVEGSKNKLLALLNNIKKNNKHIVGYAATSKSTTILNYCNIGTELIDCIYDTTPIKINKLSPGKHIPIKSYDEFKNSMVDYAYLFAWNHFKEIHKKESVFIENGGKWILHVPEVKIM